MLLFVAKNKDAFLVHNTVTYSRTGGGLVSAYPGWRKHHSRMQARYRGYEIFNKLNRDIRNETQLSKYKWKIRDSIAHSAQVRYRCDKMS